MEAHRRINGDLVVTTDEQTFVIDRTVANMFDYEDITARNIRFATFICVWNPERSGINISFIEDRVSIGGARIPQNLFHGLAGYGNYNIRLSSEDPRIFAIRKNDKSTVEQVFGNGVNVYTTRGAALSMIAENYRREVEKKIAGDWTVVVVYTDGSFETLSNEELKERLR